MKQKRDKNGKFVKMYPTREEYIAKIAMLEDTVDSLAHQCQEAKNECAFWMQEHAVVAEQNRKLNKDLVRQHNIRGWFLNHAGPILRWRYFRAVNNKEL